MPPQICYVNLNIRYKGTRNKSKHQRQWNEKLVTQAAWIDPQNSDKVFEKTCSLWIVKKSKTFSEDKQHHVVNNSQGA
jgi:hypothetical protein